MNKSSDYHFNINILYINTIKDFINNFSNNIKINKNDDAIGQAKNNIEFQIIN